MLDPNSNVAEALAEALRHHQKNLAESKKAEQDLEKLRRMLETSQELAGEDGGDGTASAES